MTTPKTVWIVVRGEDREGGSVLAVCATRNRALVVAINARSDPNRWTRTLDEPDRIQWHDDGCDWITARKVKVLK